MAKWGGRIGRRKRLSCSSPKRKSSAWPCCPLSDTFRHRKMRSRVVMILHDAIWVEAPQEEAEEAHKQLEHAMKHAVEMPFVSLDVDLE